MKLFDSFLNFISGFRKEEQYTPVVESYSKFEEFLFFVDENEEGYDGVKQAVELFDTAIKIAKQKKIFLIKHKEYENILEDVSCYEKLNAEEGEYLKDLVDKYVSLAKEKNELRYQIGDYSRSLDVLMDLEEEAPADIDRMEEAEQHERILKQDLQYLKQEKHELEIEKENLEFGLKFIYNFTIGMVILFAVCVMLLAFLHVFKQQVIFLPLAVLSVLLLFLISLIYFFKRKINFELKVNRKKQVRAVELINKKTVVYSHYLSLLNYEYKKYNVTSALMLKNNLKDYGHYKHVTTRYDSIRNIMYQTQKLLEDFMREKNIKDFSASIESFAKNIDVDDKIEYSKNIADKKSYTEQQIEMLDEQNEAIWKIIYDLNESDVTEDKIIERMIETYNFELEKIDFDVDKPEKVI